jgi:sugar phosphate isomerase/epimerase
MSLEDPMSVTDILSIQLYTLRSLENLDRILDTVAEAGYRHVETVGSHLESASDVRSKLDARGLKASSSHVSLAALREKPGAVIDACHALDLKHLYMPAVPPEQRDMAADGWRSLGQELGKLAEHFQEHGIRLGYHNHHWELTPKDGSKAALELIFEAAGSSPLTWQVDVAWLVRGNVDPKEWINRYRDRITAAHVKDIAPPGQNEDQDGWADVGSGVLKWHDLWRFCRDAGAEWMVVEHDKPANPEQTARNSFAFLRTIED